MHQGLEEGFHTGPCFLYWFCSWSFTCSGERATSVAEQQRLWPLDLGRFADGLRGNEAFPRFDSDAILQAENSASGSNLLTLTVVLKALLLHMACKDGSLL